MNTTAHNNKALLPEGAKITPMLKQWLEAKERARDAILLFRMGDFYELFADDAVTAAPILELTLTSRDKNSTEAKVSMAGFPHHSAPSYIAKLVSAGLKVAICDQMEDPQYAKGIVKRQVTRIVTPGTVIDEDGLKPNKNNFLVAIKLIENKFGIAALDLSTGDFSATCTQSFDSFLDEISKLSPSEVLLVKAEWSEKLLVLLNENLIKHQPCLLEFRTTSSVSSLKQIGMLDEWFLIDKNSVAVKSAELILDYVEDTQGGILEHIVSLKPYSIDAQLIIDATSRKHLDLIGPPSDLRREGTLLWVLDKTCTAMGGRLLVRWLLSPSTDLLIINQRHDLVQALLDQPGILKSLRVLLKEVYDLERLSAKIASSRANPRDLAQLRNSLQQLPAVFSALQNCALPKLQYFITATDLLEDVYLLLEQALVYDPPFTLKEGGIFKPKYDAELDELVNLSMGGRDQIAAIEQRERDLTKISSLKIKYTRVFGYYIEITKTHLAKVPEHYRRKQTVAAGERYVTPELIILEEQVATCEVRKQNKESELFEILRQNLNKQASRLLKSAQIIAQLDVLTTFAEVADRQRYVRPNLLPMSNRKMHIVEGRHPVVEVLTNKRKNTFVPNNTEMSTDTNRLLLITGPNMAGKSTIMRQVALIQLMAQAGSFIPAQSGVLSLCDRIFTRVGASDDLVEGRSTFMVEMTETAHILNHATESSLVVLDEIGRGTSTYDGLSLAFAVAEYLHDVVKARTLFATHYHELVWLTKNLSGVKNVQVAVQETNSNISFLYRLIDGAAEQSYGIHVARLAGLPKTVLQRAENVLRGLESEAKINEVNTAGLDKIEKTPQLNLFSQTLFDNTNVRQLVDLIDKVDVNQTTPLEALNQLVQIKNIAKTV